MNEQPQTPYIINRIDRRALSTGVVSLIKVIEGDHTFQKGEKPLFITNKGNKLVTALDIRKIVFEEKDGYGEDVFYSLKGNNYQYRVVSVANEEYENNTIVIRNPRFLSDVLYYVGLPTHVDELQMKSVRKMLLSSDEKLRIMKHSRTLTEKGIIPPERVREINSQAATLYHFKKLDLPTKPQKIEKVYSKHFK